MSFKHFAPFLALPVLFAGAPLEARPVPVKAPAGANLLAGLNNFDNTPLIENPWGGVINGALAVPPGGQLAVDDRGHLARLAFSPSVAVGDLNGDGLLDLVVADPRGYFWFYPNSGTVTAPKFTAGEVMPIWLGTPINKGNEEERFRINSDTAINTVPRIQLVDFSNEKKLSIVAGNFRGQLFYIRNTGTSQQPAFAMPRDLDSIAISTYSGAKLWCNYFAPFLYDFTGNGHLDMVMGEGTYASNSIYRLINKGTNGSPTFSEKTTEKIIRGEGREHLNPQVVDWNNDGKPDIITGERLGFITVFLNTSTDPSRLQFDGGTHVRFGAKDTTGPLTTVTVGDLSGNKRPDLVVSNSSNLLLYARDQGKPGKPVYGLLQKIPGVNPFPKVNAPGAGWALTKALSMPYVLMASVKAQDDPTFESPDPSVKSALKVFTVPHKHAYFPQEIYPEDDIHVFGSGQRVPLEAGVHYTTSFWVKSTGGVNSLTYVYAADEFFGNEDDEGHRHIWLQSEVRGIGTSWTHYTGSTYLEKLDRIKAMGQEEMPAVRMAFAFTGQGDVMISGISLTKD